MTSSFVQNSTISHSLSTRYQKQYQHHWVEFRLPSVAATNKTQHASNFQHQHALVWEKRKFYANHSEVLAASLQRPTSRTSYNMAVAICPRLRFLSPLLSHIAVYGDLIRETSPYAHWICDACRELCVICQDILYVLYMPYACTPRVWLKYYLTILQPCPTRI